MSKSNVLVLEPGKRVTYQNECYRIVQILSLTEAELVDEATHKPVTANITDLTPPKVDVPASRQDLLAIDDNAWEVAKTRLAIIKPLLKVEARTRGHVCEIAKKNSLHANTLYLWIRSYEASGALSSLLPKSRTDKGQTKFNEDIEEIIREVLATDYLTKQKKSKQKVCNEVRKRCAEQGLKAPHDNTIRNRINALSGELVERKRLGRSVADANYRPHEGQFPGAKWPLAVVQIDHTKLDIILVDDHYRRPIGRPWITLSFDVYSRLVTGFYVSFDPPSALSTGLCLAHSILPKEVWLAKYDVKSVWPVWGLPTTVHADNAKEFRGNMLQRACDEYGINLEWRPVGRPNFGAHVERALGTLSKEIHTLPGTTFSNTQEKGDYDSEKNASLTLSEFEAWLSIYIVDVYHQKNHSSLGTTPMAMYKQGIFGDDESPGCGLPAKITDEDRLKLDFMPFELRTVQDYGVVIDEVHYYHDVLRRWINAPDPNDKNKKRKFTFRRDPRDISQLWFYDPELHTYYAIPYRDTSHPAISIWELREARKTVKADGRRHVDEQALFDAYERMREVERQAVEKSKAARRSKQRRTQHKATPKPQAQAQTQNIETEPQEQTLDSPVIEPFDEMDEL